MYKNKYVVVACLDKVVITCLDEDAVVFLDNGVATFLDKNNKADFDVDISHSIYECLEKFS